MADRCTGHCCFPIHLPMGPEELERNKEKYTDGTIMAESFVYLNRQTKGKQTEGDRFLYACKYFKDGQCSIQESKPKVCWDYPYGRSCKIPGCTWSAVAQLALPRMEK